MTSNPFERKQIEWRTSLTSFSAQTVVIKMLSQLEQSIYAETTTAVIEKGQIVLPVGNMTSSIFYIVFV